MTSLEELRTQLSDVDDQITDLYEKRMKICEDLGTCKIKNGYKTFDRQREKNKIHQTLIKKESEKYMNCFLRSVENYSTSSL